MPSAVAHPNWFRAGNCARLPGGEPLYVVKDPATASLRGVSIEIGKELAARFGVPLEACPFTTVRDLIHATDADEWDLATVVAEHDRATVLDFSTPYLEAELDISRAAQSKASATSHDADVLGIRIGVAERRLSICS